MSNAQDDWRQALDRANGLRFTDASQARREFETAVHLAQRTGGESPVHAWIAFSEFLIAQNDHRQAEAALRKALALQEELVTNRPILRASILHGLAVTRLTLGSRAESIELLQKEIALLDGSTGVDEGAVLPAINLLSALYAEAGKIIEARVTIRKALTIARRPERSTGAAKAWSVLTVANMWIVLSEIERTAGNYDEARRAARNALKLIQLPTVEKAPFFERVHNQLARIACETADYKAAADHWKLTLDSLASRREEGDAEVLSVRADIARVALMQGRQQEAEKELIAVVRLAEGNASQIALARGLYVLGLAYSMQKKFDDARTAFVRSLAISDRELGEMSAHSALCVARLAAIYLKNGRPAEAVNFSSRATRLPGGDDAVSMPWLDVMEVHAKVLRKLRQKSEAKAFQQRASKLLASKRGGNQTIDVMDLMRQ